MTRLTFGYANFFVSDFERSLVFFRDQLGLKVLKEDEGFGYASFDTGPAHTAFARSPDEPELIGLMARDVHLAYEEMRAAGVEFELPPAMQPRDGVLALFKGLDGFVFYPDEVQKGDTIGGI